MEGKVESKAVLAVAARGPKIAETGNTTSRGSGASYSYGGDRKTYELKPKDGAHYHLGSPGPRRCCWLRWRSLGMAG